MPAMSIPSSSSSSSSDSSAAGCCDRLDDSSCCDPSLWQAGPVADPWRGQQKTNFGIVSDAPVNLYVNFLPMTVSPSELRSRFCPYGDVLSVRVMLREDGQPRGYGFVLMADLDGAAAAIAGENGAAWDNKRLSVFIAESTPRGRNTAQQSVPPPYTKNRTALATPGRSLSPPQPSFKEAPSPRSNAAPVTVNPLTIAFSATVQRYIAQQSPDQTRFPTNA